MAIKGVFMLLTAITYLMSMSISSAREIPFQSHIPGLFNPTRAGLEVKGEALDCWTALYRIKSCSNEIVAYFDDGTIDITPPCCEAITLITHHCWPAVLSTLGYSPDQTYILRGYCDASASYAASFGPVSSPMGPVSSPFRQPMPAVN